MSVTTIKLGERLTHESVLHWRGVFENWMPTVDGTLTVDCLDLHTIDGDGIGLLAWAINKRKLDKKDLKLDNVLGQPRRMLKTLGILNLIEV